MKKVNYINLRENCSFFEEWLPSQAAVLPHPSTDMSLCISGLQRCKGKAAINSQKVAAVLVLPIFLVGM